MTKCEQFKQQTNKYPSKITESADERRLVQWLNSQRQALNGNGNRIKMTEERR